MAVTLVSPDLAAVMVMVALALAPVPFISGVVLAVILSLSEAPLSEVLARVGAVRVGTTALVPITAGVKFSVS